MRQRWSEKTRAGEKLLQTSHHEILSAHDAGSLSFQLTIPPISNNTASICSFLPFPCVNVCEFLFHKKSGRIELHLLGRESQPERLLPGIAPSHQNRCEPSQFHHVPHLKGNMLLTGCITIPETRMAWDISCEFLEREHWPDLNSQLSAPCKVLTQVPRGV